DGDDLPAPLLGRGADPPQHGDVERVVVLGQRDTDGDSGLRARRHGDADGHDEEREENGDASTHGSPSFGEHYAGGEGEVVSRNHRRRRIPPPITLTAPRPLATLSCMVPLATSCADARWRT